MNLFNDQDIFAEIDSLSEKNSASGSSSNKMFQFVSGYPRVINFATMVEAFNKEVFRGHEPRLRNHHHDLVDPIAFEDEINSINFDSFGQIPHSNNLQADDNSNMNNGNQFLSATKSIIISVLSPNLNHHQNNDSPVLNNITVDAISTLLQPTNLNVNQNYFRII
jgi:hypothetical protein